MTKLYFLLCMVSLLIGPYTFPLAKNQFQQPAVKVPSQDEYERQRRLFKPAKELLDQKGVPFEAETLLDPEWRTKLYPVFNQMREMQIERRLGKELKGVQLADVLYLPEKVNITGDTVIIAQRIVHEGADVVIKGPHNIYIFPIEDWGSLGTTLEQAIRKDGRLAQGVQFMPARFSETPLRSRFVPQLIADGRITINTDGEGYLEWLEKQKEKKKHLSEVSFVKTGFRVQPQYNSDGNSPGGIGATGAGVNAGANGTLDPAATGSAGSVSEVGPMAKLEILEMLVARPKLPVKEAREIRVEMPRVNT